MESGEKSMFSKEVTAMAHDEDLRHGAIELVGRMVQYFAQKGTKSALLSDFISTVSKSGSIQALKTPEDVQKCLNVLLDKVPEWVSVKPSKLHPTQKMIAVNTLSSATQVRQKIVEARI
eukprot:Platyproteum_vivax@DN7334_c0_g1_i2.p1